MSDSLSANKPKHPVFRLAVGFLIMIAIYAVCSGIIALLVMRSYISADLTALIVSIVSAILMIVAYSAFYKGSEHRKITELSFKEPGKTLLPGIGVGFVFMGAVILTLYLGGAYKVLRVNGLEYAIGGLGVGIVSSVGEELLFRGILFRIMEERLGSITALTISALIFGLIHLGNPNSSLFMALCIAIEAGLLLGAAYMYSRNLWLPIGIHFAWNFSESGIFGVANSGTLISHSLLTSQTTGNKLFTGGSMGPEGSMPCLIAGVTISLTLLYLAKKNGRFIPAFAKPNTISSISASPDQNPPDFSA